MKEEAVAETTVALLRVQGSQSGAKADQTAFATVLPAEEASSLAAKPRLVSFSDAASLHICGGITAAQFQKLSASVEAFKMGQSMRRRQRKQSVTVRALD